MHITGTHISYYHLCYRKLWLFAQEVVMEQSSDLVYEGRLIGDSSYPERAARHTELALRHENLLARIDYYDARQKVVHEVKKSDKLEHAHVAQVQFYLYLLEKNGILEARGRIEYPRLRQTLEVPPLSEEDRTEVEHWLAEISHLIQLERCPEKVKKPYCKNCAYYDFCYVEE
ncbi:MAG: CRISPR-associated protein Cas4 [Microscillaceae bacterium]|nr:CRISPR-associated protein Cas4 [Microscillaceae bacterium]